MSSVLKLALVSPVCQLGGMIVGGGAGALVHAQLPGHEMDLARVLPAAFFALLGLLGGGVLWGALVAQFAGSPNVRRGAAAGAVWAVATLAGALALTPLEQALVERGGSTLPLHNLYTLLFVPVAFVVSLIAAWAMITALGRHGRAARTALMVACAVALSYLIVDVGMDLLGWRVGAPGAVDRATMLTVTFVSGAAASAALGGMLGAVLSRDYARRSTHWESVEQRATS